MATRREFLTIAAAGGASLLLPATMWGPGTRPASARAATLVALPGGTLDPIGIPKYVQPLVIPPVMPRTSTLANGTIDSYVIGVRQFAQQVLPPGLPKTTVWGYGSVDHPETFNYPAFTIEATVDRPVRVRWINDLVDEGGNFLPHLLPVDPTLHWANPVGGVGGRDMRPTFTSTPGPYTGPVPLVTHLHGGHSRRATATPRPGISPPRATSPPGTHVSDPSTMSSRPSPSVPSGQFGIRAARCSNTQTISALPPSGSTTTHWG
jgi:spore coat protein A